ncbi:MAG: AtpZ/AtpI family protein [Thermoleophilia bacterium]|nr:AtpZ/AtpI family protein [Thermoleophilia bacterium]
MTRDPQRDPAQTGGLAFTFVALVLVFAGLGFGADRWLGTEPWLMVLGVFVGAGLGFAYLALILFRGSGKRLGEKTEDRPKTRGSEKRSQ